MLKKEIEELININNEMMIILCGFDIN